MQISVDPDGQGQIMQFDPDLVGIQAIVFLITLIYVHTVFATHPATCLDFIKDDWPKEGGFID